LPLLLFALNINVDYGNAKKPYEVLTLYNKTPFTCIKKENKIECVFDKKPTTPVFKDKSYFFKIVPRFDKKFVIDIYAKGKYRLFAFKDNQYNNPLITPFKLKKAKKWVIVANEQFLSKKPLTGLKFYYKDAIYPYVGAVDENLNPVKEVKSEDVIKYFEILKAYKQGRDVLDEIDDFVKRYPKSLFLPDVLYLKLKILDKENDSEAVVELGKEWIKKFAFSEKLPEVLLLIGKNYAKMGFVSDASYYYNRIITEYPNSKYAYLAMIYLADQLYSMGNEKKAFKLYKDVLYSTTNLDVASLAAARLASRYMAKGEIKKAIEYYEKIYNANKEFLLKDKKKAYELANTLASHGVYSLAVKIGEDLLKRLKKLDDLYEPLLYKLAVWSYEEGNYKKALYFINKYLKEFPYGDYSDAAKILRDKILFNLPESNLTKKLEYINNILKNYQGEIALKALVQKAKILYKMKKYDEIVKMLPKLKTIPEKYFPDKKEFIKKVLKEYAIYLLEHKKCLKAVNLIKKYKITLDKKYDDLVYECAIKARDYQLASVVCNKYLDSPNDKVFVKWIKRKIKALKGLGDYEGVVKAVDDLCQVEKNCYEYMLDKFFALWKLKRYKEALEVAKKLEKYQDIRNADAFIKIVNWALENNDNLLAASFAKKIIDLQNRFKTYPYSPFVEFVYAKYSKNKKEAIKVLKNLLPRVKGEDRARALFMLANLTGDKKYLQKCLKVKDSKVWRGLCKDAMDLF
jgi:TolA-binding protein